MFIILIIQVSEVLSQDVLLNSEGSGQNSFSNVTGNIREVEIMAGWMIEMGRLRKEGREEGERKRECVCEREREGGGGG